MPTYDYFCQACHYQTEITQKINDIPLSVCPHCHKSSLKRGPGGGIALHFKGKGFYITDYQPSEKTNSSSITKEACPCKQKNSK